MTDSDSHPKRGFDPDDEALTSAVDGEAWSEWTLPNSVPFEEPARATEVIDPDNRRFRFSLLRTTVGNIIPGVGLYNTPRHRLGIVASALFIITVVLLIVLAVGKTNAFVAIVIRSEVLLAASIALGVAALAWVGMILMTYLTSKPSALSGAQRAIGAAVVGVMSAIVSIPLSVGSAYALETYLLTQNVFQHGESQTRPELDTFDPWKDIPRVNILLLGGDSGEQRDETLGVRTDSIMVASIDTKTGNMVLIQLPRNLQNPIFAPESPLAEVYPYGFDDGEQGMINAVWNNVPLAHPELFTDTEYPGADALKWAAHGVTGLPMHYFAMINMDGLIQLVDAMGGVTVNVNFPIAKGGSIENNCGEEGWIPEGPDQHLNGRDAMWYARSRCNDAHPSGPDFGRMQRQSCLVNAVVDQADVMKLALRYEEISKAAEGMLETDIPREDLSAFTELALRIQQSRHITRLSFVYGEHGFDSSNPDFDLMHAQVQHAIDVSMAEPEPEPEPSSDPTTDVEVSEPAPEPEPVPEPVPGTEPVPGDVPSEEPAPEDPAQDISDVCGYHHQEPASWVPVPPTVPVYVPEEESPE